MKQLKKHLLLLFTAVLISITSSCSKDDDGEGGGSGSTKGYAPTSLVEKTLWSSKIVNEFEFSSTSFNIKFRMLPDNMSTIGTPSYTYKKTGDNTATLKMNFKTQMKIAGTTSVFTYENSFNLTFTSESEGILNGTEKTSSTSTALPPDSNSREYTDTFTLK